MKTNPIQIVVSLLLLIVGSAAALGYYQIVHRAEGNYFKSDTQKIFYTRTGNPEKPSVILLHGFAVNADLNFERTGISKFLEADFDVIRMDLRGHGNSSKPHNKNEYGKKMSEDVIALMNHLKIEKAFLAGYSLGGFIALQLAVLYPHRFYAIAPMGCGWEKLPEKNFFQQLAPVAEALRNGEAIKPLISYIDPERPTGWVHTQWVRLMTLFFNDPLALAAVIEGAHDFILSENGIRKIELPLYCITGTQDPFFKSAQLLAATAAHATLIRVENEDHVSTAKSIITHQALLAAFLKSTPSSKVNDTF